MNFEYTENELNEELRQAQEMIDSTDITPAGYVRHPGLFCVKTDERVAARRTLGRNGSPEWGLLDGEDASTASIYRFVPALPPFPLDPMMNEEFDAYSLQSQDEMIIAYYRDQQAYDELVEKQMQAGYYETGEDVPSFAQIWDRSPKHSSNPYLGSKYVMVGRRDRGSPLGAMVTVPFGKVAGRK